MTSQPRSTRGHRPTPARAVAVAVALAGGLVLASVALLVAGGKAGPASATGSSAGTTSTGDITTDWTVYHGSPTGSGVAAAPELSSATRRWTSPALDGDLFGEPLVEGDVVYAATEDDTVYALSATDGHVLWSTHVGTPVPSGDLPCGDITPTVGITGTPVIDPARHELFAVADELAGEAPSHVLIGIDTDTGAVELHQAIDPSGVYTPALLQRTGLALDQGRVVLGMGGNFGDCSTYNGWVVSVPEAGGTAAYYEVDSGAGEHQGAVWMGGAAPEVTASGDIWLAAGNGSVTTPTPYDGSDAVLELSPALKLLQYFAPSDWYEDNANDRDLGSSSPALLADGLVVQAGKSQTAYLLNGAALGGVGGQTATLPGVCSENVDGGVAVVGEVAYLPCQSGVVAVEATTGPDALHLLWHTPSGSGGPPIVAGGLVWTISQSGVLYGLDPSNGMVVEQFSIGSVANHFPTPSYGDGLLLAPAMDTVSAFAPATPAPTTTTAPGRKPTVTHARRSTGKRRKRAAAQTTSTAKSTGHSTAVVATAATLGALAVLAALAALVLHLRRRGHP